MVLAQGSFILALKWSIVVWLVHEEMSGVRNDIDWKDSFRSIKIMFINPIFKKEGNEFDLNLTFIDTPSNSVLNLNQIKRQILAFFLI